MKETLPSYEAMMPAVLKVLADESPALYVWVFERVLPALRLYSEQLADTLPSGHKPRCSRVGWAKTYLVKADLIETTRRAFALSPNGVRRHCSLGTYYRQPLSGPIPTSSWRFTWPPVRAQAIH